jgi:hypothetical protein
MTLPRYVFFERGSKQVKSPTEWRGIFRHNLRLAKTFILHSLCFHRAFLYSILMNPPTKCTIDDKLTFYSLTSPTPTCFGASSHHPQGDFALQRPFHSEGDRLCNIVAKTYNVYTHTHTHTVPYWIVKIVVFIVLILTIH